MSWLDKAKEAGQNLLKWYKTDVAPKVKDFNEKYGKPTTAVTPGQSATPGYNGNPDFKQWYKNQYGEDFNSATGLVRKDGMSDGDWDVGTILYNNYIKGQNDEQARENNKIGINETYDNLEATAKAGYQTARDTLAEGKKVAQQNASVTYDKMRKYLPMKAKAQGIGGQGSVQSGLDAYNTYMSSMGKIASDYNSDMREIDATETEHIGELKNFRSERLAENDAVFDGYARERSENTDTDARSAWDKYVKAEKDAATDRYNRVDNIIKNYSGTNADELIGYINTHYAGHEDSADYRALVEAAKSRVDGNVETTKNTEFENEILESEKEYYDAERANTAYTNITGYIDSGKYSADELQSFYNEVEGVLTSAQKTELSSRITEQKKHEDTVNRYLGNAQRVNAKINSLAPLKTSALVNIDGKEYQVFTSKTNDAAVIDFAQYMPGETMFGYNGKVYARVGEDVFELQNASYRGYGNWNALSSRLNSGKATEKTWTANGTLR